MTQGCTYSQQMLHFNCTMEENVATIEPKIAVRRESLDTQL
jgi:hypothetical protein